MVLVRLVGTLAYHVTVKPLVEWYLWLFGDAFWMVSVFCNEMFFTLKAPKTTVQEGPVLTPVHFPWMRVQFVTSTAPNGLCYLDLKITHKLPFGTHRLKGVLGQIRHNDDILYEAPLTTVGGVSQVRFRFVPMEIEPFCRIQLVREL